MNKKKVFISLPDSSVHSFESGITGIEIASYLSKSLTKRILAIEINGLLCDLMRPIYSDSTIRLLTWDDTGGRHAFWHSSAHLLAQALEELYPGVLLGIGPAIEEGFYYDVDFGNYIFSSDDCITVEKKMLELASVKNPFIRQNISKKEALSFFKARHNTYKLELIEGLEEGEITFYQQGNFRDLCRGPHLPHTGLIKAVKLTTVAGAYWRGDVNRKQLTRIYGISFPKKSLLDEYIKRVQEAQLRDHRKLGRELGLFTFSKEVGLGLPIWLPKGAFLREQLQHYLQEEQRKEGYLPVITPHIGHKDLYVTSGHYEKYKESSFQPIETPHEEEKFLLKPMNCPHHCIIYKENMHSYRDLPLRLAEFGNVYRYEQHGELHGLLRVRGFTQDDAHIFCTHEQVEDELRNVLTLVHKVLNKFQFTQYSIELSLRDIKKQNQYIGDPDAWNGAEKTIRQVVQDMGIDCIESQGEAAFYGPKIDFIVKDALGRRWQLGTVQLDYQLPIRFDLTYIDPQNKKKRPVMIHRAPFGSMERFIAILLEHTGGKLPLWLAPTQLIILPIADRHFNYAEKWTSMLKEKGIRSTIDQRSEKIGKKIRDAELQKIPYMAIVGDQEVNRNQISLRKQGVGVLGSKSWEDTIAYFNKETANQ